MSARLAPIDRSSGGSQPCGSRIMALDGQCEQRRQRILNRAALAFLAEGYEGANLEDIAIAAGISKVTIYRHFDDKMHLFETVITDAARSLGAGLVDILPRDQPVELVLERFARVFIERMMSPAGTGYPFYQLARVLVGATVRQPIISQSCKWIFTDLIGAPLAAYFKSKIESGEIAGEDPQYLAQHFVQTLFFTNAVAMDPSLLPAPHETAGLARRKVRLFLYGAAAGGTSRD
jgi:TetR/AcrR family transcriptional regulator, mexJK operon transcriptional repressor